jgi:hypothetical protein
MLRTISSRATWLLKAISCLWIALFLIITLGLFYSRFVGQSVPVPLLGILVTGTIVGSAVLFHYCLRCKRVAMDGASLVISNFWHTAAVPLEEIESVRQSRWLSTRQVTLNLRHNTTVGRCVIFMPELVTWWIGFPAPEHPIVAELRAAAVSRSREAI